MVKDRRMFHRIEGIVNVRYAVKGRDRIKAESLPRNIGGGGIGVCLAEKLTPGTRMELEITVPDNPRKVITCVGKVLWSKPFGVIGSDSVRILYETGIKFIETNQVAIGRVYTYARSSPLSRQK